VETIVSSDSIVSSLSVCRRATDGTTARGKKDFLGAEDSFGFPQVMPKTRQYWLVKQEPTDYSWDDFVKDKGCEWDGVRNYQARNNLRAMKKGDLLLFYHSVKEKRIVGIAKLAREHYPDPTATEGDWSCVDLKPVKAVKTPVTLDEIKEQKNLQDMVLLNNTRLSVQPLTKKQFDQLVKMSGTKL
tara:strand:- start:1224 stop:1781 length:558 start_codon:yes stop_codon:yes gene_type:complete